MPAQFGCTRILSQKSIHRQPRTTNEKLRSAALKQESVNTKTNARSAKERTQWRKRNQNIENSQRTIYFLFSTYKFSLTLTQKIWVFSLALKTLSWSSNLSNTRRADRVMHRANHLCRPKARHARNVKEPERQQYRETSCCSDDAIRQCVFMCIRVCAMCVYAGCTCIAFAHVMHVHVSAYAHVYAWVIFVVERRMKWWKRGGPFVVARQAPPGVWHTSFSRWCWANNAMRSRSFQLSRTIIAKLIGDWSQSSTLNFGRSQQWFFFLHRMPIFTLFIQCFIYLNRKVYHQILICRSVFAACSHAMDGWHFHRVCLSYPKYQITGDFGFSTKMLNDIRMNWNIQNYNYKIPIIFFNYTINRNQLLSNSLFKTDRKITSWILMNGNSPSAERSATYIYISKENYFDRFQCPYIYCQTNKIILILAVSDYYRVFVQVKWEKSTQYIKMRRGKLFRMWKTH